jgi:hypothetical protein
MSVLKWLLNHLWKRDKLYHLIAGTLIYIAGALLFSPAMGLILAILAGGAKETYDEFIKKTGGDLWDYFATIFLPVILFLISTI